MNLLSNERGYTLFLTVLITLLFGILATVLITTTVSGAKKSAFREDNTQAHELAEKGLNYVTYEINDKLQKELDKEVDGLKKTDFIIEINKVLDEYKCEAVDAKEEETGAYETCVEDNGPDELPKVVTFKSTGLVDEVKKELTAVVEMGGNGLPDYMQYAVNAFTTAECLDELKKDCKGGEGNLFLHGGASIQGDINVMRNLVTSNRSFEKYGTKVFDTGNHWIHSYFPSVKNKEDGSASKIIVGEDIYTFQWDEPGTLINGFGHADYAQHIAAANIPADSPNIIKYVKHDEIDENVFVGSHVPVRSNRIDHPNRHQFDISAQKENYAYGPDEEGVKQIETNLFGTGGVDRVILDEDYSNDKVFPKWYKNFEGKFIIRGKSTFKQFSTYGDVQLGRVRKNSVVEFIEGAYIGGNLTIHNSVEVKGPIYVEGDLFIEGKDVTINSVIFVNGEVHIKHATGDSTIDSNIKGDQVIFANKKIFMLRTNRFNDHPAEINGFFYSKESIEMDGNESNIKIRGGLSAPRIVLNSIRGRSYAASKARQKKPQIVEGRAYEGSAEQARRESRLQIIYDEAVMLKYSDLILEDRVESLPPPNIIELEERNL